MSEFAESVNEAIKGAVDGKLADDLNESVKYAATSEMRRRDTQSAFTKEQQRGDRLETENTKMADVWGAEVAKNLTDEQRTSLEELKHTDPEAWREALNKHESDNAEKFKETRKKISTEAKEETELQRRTRVLSEYNEANPDSQLTDDVINNDLPPRITKQLADGKIDFDEFVKQATTYLGKPKVIDKGEEIKKTPDLSDVGGSNVPPEDAIAAEADATYKGEIY